MDDKVSVIVPIYNVEKYVKECVESIINQDYKNIEIILVDDGSTDDSGKICDEMQKKDNRIIVIHQKNGGVSNARNNGIKKATGKYICFVDGDDYVMKDYVSYLYNLAEQNDANIGVTSEPFTSFNSKQNEEKIENLTGKEATIKILCYNMMIGVYGKIFRRKYLEKNNIRLFEDLVIGEGFNFNVLSFQYTDKIVRSTKKIYVYRKNLKSVTNKFNEEKWKNGIDALYRIHDIIVYKSKKINEAWKYAYWRTNSDAFDQVALSEEKNNHKEFYNETRKIVKRDAKIALKVPISKKDKLRAMVMMINPNIIPMAMKIRLKMFRNKIR